MLGWGGGVCFLGLSLITDRLSNVTMGLPSEWMIMLMTEKETCHEMMDRSVEASIKCLEQLHEAVGDCCFAWGIAADDSGTQRGEFIRPELWAEMIKPHYARLCDWIHRNTHWKTFLHCCGSIYHLIPHMIEAGVDILNPIQTSAANMEPERLKAEFGGKIVFWGGGCDTQRVLPTATPEEIREHVRERLAIFKPGGGIRLQPGSQHPAQRPRREHHRHAGRRLRVRLIPKRGALPTIQELFDLTGRVAVVAGGAGLLGFQMAAALADEESSRNHLYHERRLSC